MEDIQHKRTVPCPRYIEPTDEHIKKRFEEIGFTKPYSHNFVRDVSNYYSWIFYGMDPTCSLVADSENKYAKGVHNFLQSINYDMYTGFTPIEKAASVIAAFANIKASSTGNTEGEVIHLFLEENERVEDTVSAIEELIEDTEYILSSDIYETLINIPGNQIPEVTISKLNIDKLKMINRLSVLKSRGNIKARRELPKKEIQTMTEYGQVANLSSMSQMAMPTFKHKLAAKSLFVSKKTQATKQLLVLLIDLSHSMTDPDRYDWVKAIIANRCQAVAEKKAELYIVGYRENVYLKDTIRVKSAEEINVLRRNYFYHGWKDRMCSTNVALALQEVYKAIRANKMGKYHLHGERPQVVIIADGEDGAENLTTMDYPTHMFMLGPKDNKPLMKFILDKGGTYERFEK